MGGAPARSNAEMAMATHETVSHIAKTLGEVGEIPISQIDAIVRVLGEEGARALLSDTLEVERNGGQLLVDGKGRRSPGGVFFQLARGRLSREEKREIFYKTKPVGAPAPSAPLSSPPPGPASERPSAFPRRRVIDVAPVRSSPLPEKPLSFALPELGSALARARVRPKVAKAIASLPLEDQYRLLLEMLAEIHDRVAGGVDPSVVDPPASARRAKRNEPSGSSGTLG